jgi:YfiH family protein
VINSHKKRSSLLSSHIFFNRHGGVSRGCFDSLNAARSVGDSPDHVRENLGIIKEQCGVNVLITAHQIHGDIIAVIDSDVDSDRCVDGVDALITNQQGVGLAVQLADCQGVLLHDPVHSVVAAIHCGWRGSVIGIIDKTVKKMGLVFGSDPINLHAFVSPSLGPCCAEFIHYKKELPCDFHAFQVKPHYFDFWKISRYQLTGAGLVGEHIEVAGICTSCSNDYYSYRRACRDGDGRTGRHCAVISLQ